MGHPVVFSDATARSGLDGFRHSAGSQVKRFLMEVPSGGVALFDYDRDGWIDIYLVNGSNFEALRGQQEHPKAALYRNNGDGTFTDTTAVAGVANEGWGFGAAVGDYDNDGWPDLHVTNFGKDRLYRNNGDGSFSDVTDRAGISIPGWSTAASFGDFDRDGDLGPLRLWVSGIPPLPRIDSQPSGGMSAGPEGGNGDGSGDSALGEGIGPILLHDPPTCLQLPWQTGPVRSPGPHRNPRLPPSATTGTAPSPT